MSQPKEDGDEGAREPAVGAGPARPELTVFLPVYNEAMTVERIVSAFHDTVVRPTHAEFLICEDGSSDGTAAILRQLRAKIPMHLVQGPSRKGYTGAVRDGLALVSTPYVFFADSDGQYDPADFWKLWPDGKPYDMVIGVKVARDEEFYRILLSRGFHVLAHAFTGVPLHDMDCGFRIIRREVIDAVLPEATTLRYSFWAEFTILAYHKGFRILEIPVSHRSRPEGVSATYTPRRLPGIVLHQLRGIAAMSRRLQRMPKHDSK